MTAGQDPAHSSSLVSHRVRVGAAELECAWFALDEHRRPTIVFLHEGLGSIAPWAVTG
jgi:hypothetical protein